MRSVSKFGLQTAAVFAAAALWACSPPQVAPHVPTAAEWRAARARLSDLRAAEDTGPYVEQIRIAMREPRTGRVVVARGAVAVRPHDAMRMVLIGPGGTTALDVWVTRARWRVEIPAVDVKRKGEANPPAEEGLPIAFFRWWFLAPYEGRLLDARAEDGAMVFLLRAGGGTVWMREAPSVRGREVLALRRERGVLERLEWSGRGGAPHPGDHARYVHSSTGLAVEVMVDALGEAEPDPAAFLDPDETGVPL